MILYMVAHAPVWFAKVCHLQPTHAATRMSAAVAHGPVGIWHVCAEVHDVCAAAALSLEIRRKGSGCTYT